MFPKNKTELLTYADDGMLQSLGHTPIVQTATNQQDSWDELRNEK
jgi:hypothetical protein